MQFSDQKLNQGRDISKGDLLLAEPFMQDPNFSRSVVLLCEHDQQEGTFGLVINRSSGMVVADVLEGYDRQDVLYIGGPVEQDTLHILHSLSEIEGAIPLRDGLFWGGNLEQIRLSIADHPNSVRFFMGYSGWGERQLEGELGEDAWIRSRTNLNQVLAMPINDMWQQTLRSMGDRYRVISNYPINPRLN